MGGAARSVAEGHPPPLQVTTRQESINGWVDVLAVEADLLRSEYRPHLARIQRTRAASAVGREAATLY